MDRYRVAYVPCCETCRYRSWRVCIHPERIRVDGDKAVLQDVSPLGLCELYDVHMEREF